MKHDSNEPISLLAPTKALRNLTELFEQQTRRISIMEQQYLDLAVRVGGIEDSKQKIKRF